MSKDSSVERQRLAESFEPIIQRHGLVLESLKVQHVGVTTKLSVVVDLPEDEIGSADLDTVTDISRELSELLDTDTSLIGDGPSNLEVTTPGVFRPLTELRHFKRVRTRLLDVRDVQDRIFLGRLEEVDGDILVFDVVKPPHQPKKSAKAEMKEAMVLRVPPGCHRMPWTDVAQAEVHLEFR